MAKGREKHQAHQAAVAALGKNLSRRARSRCELCESSDKLSVVEVDGSPHEDPDEDWAVLVCSGCASLIEGKPTGPVRFLESVMWSELRCVQITAVRALRTIDEPWAEAALEGLYLDPEVEELL